MICQCAYGTQLGDFLCLENFLRDCYTQEAQAPGMSLQCSACVASYGHKAQAGSHFTAFVNSGSRQAPKADLHDSDVTIVLTPLHIEDGCLAVHPQASDVQSRAHEATWIVPEIQNKALCSCALLAIVLRQIGGVQHCRGLPAARCLFPRFRTRHPPKNTASALVVSSVTRGHDKIHHVHNRSALHCRGLQDPTCSS